MYAISTNKNHSISNIAPQIHVTAYNIKGQTGQTTNDSIGLYYVSLTADNRLVYRKNTRCQLKRQRSQHSHLIDFDLW